MQSQVAITGKGEGNHAESGFPNVFIAMKQLVDNSLKFVASEQILLAIHPK